MSDQTATQLTAMSALDEDDLLVVVEDGIARKVTVAQLRQALMPIIYEDTLTVDTAEWNFSVPQTYKNLSIDIQARGTNSSVAIATLMRFNGDTGNNYETQDIWGTGSSVSAVKANDQSSAVSLETPAANATANFAAYFKIFIPRYADTTFFKNVYTVWSSPETTDSTVFMGHETSIWRSTAAITDIRLFMTTGNFKAGSWVRVRGEV